MAGNFSFPPLRHGASPQAHRPDVDDASALAEQVVRAAIVVLVAVELLESITYEWHRVARRLAAWSESVEHRRRMRRHNSELRSLWRHLPTAP